MEHSCWIIALKIQAASVHGIDWSLAAFSPAIDKTCNRESSCAPLRGRIFYRSITSDLSDNMQIFQVHYDSATLFVLWPTLDEEYSSPVK